MWDCNSYQFFCIKWVHLLKPSSNWAVYSCVQIAKTNKSHAICKRSSDEFYQDPFHWDSLGTFLEKMMPSKAVPNGLKPQECEQGSGHNKPPILYISEKVELQKQVDSSANTEWTSRGSGLNCQHNQAHSIGQGGVVSVHMVKHHPRAVYLAHSTSNRYNQAKGFVRCPQEAYVDWEGVCE